MGGVDFSVSAVASFCVKIISTGSSSFFEHWRIQNYTECFNQFVSHGLAATEGNPPPPQGANGGGFPDPPLLS